MGVVFVVGGGSDFVDVFFVEVVDGVVSDVVVSSDVVSGSDSEVGVGVAERLDVTGAAGACGLFGLSSQNPNAASPTTTMPPMIAGRFHAPGLTSSSSSTGLVRARCGGGGGGSSS